MQAIILAAGMGRRLGSLTSTNTKCMVKVNGQCIIDRLIRQLRSVPLQRIVVVTGYCGQQLRDYLTAGYPDMRIEFVDNPVYDRTNNIYSLWLARDYLMADDTILLESDMVFDDGVVQLAVESPFLNVALVGRYRPWMDGTMVMLDGDKIASFVPPKLFDYAETNRYYKTVNVYKFAQRFSINTYIPFLEAYIKVMGHNEYYEQVLRVLTLIDNTDLHAVDVAGSRWYEIDDVQDLRIAETIFASPDRRYDALTKAYGGYWRYPRLIDFCYLVNPCFPPRRMLSELRASFDTLIAAYPSGMANNTLLASRYFGVSRDYIVPGNGAAELIRSLMSLIDGPLGVVVPTFEEYINRASCPLHIFRPGRPGFRYTADDLISFFADKPLGALLIVNPDNPSGNFIPVTHLLRLLSVMAARGVTVIVDESFVDFADSDGLPPTLLHDQILERYPNLVVIKSISKSYGVPGLRLGVLASSSTHIIDTVRRDVPIWSINSFAEFYMQIFGKYATDYLDACRRFTHLRASMYDSLSLIPQIRVYPSQANYFLCRLTNGMSARTLAVSLLNKYDILIKDCTGKRGFLGHDNWFRVAVRSEADNRTLINALRSLLTPSHNDPT